MIAVVLALALAAEGPRSLTRAEALAYLAQSPGVLASARGVDIARAGVRSAGAWPNPTLGVSYGTDEPQLYGTIDQRLPIFGQRGSRVAAAQGDVAVAQAELGTRTLELRVAADEAYTALAAAQQKLDLARQAAKLAAELAQKMALKVQARLAAELDLEQAELAAARAAQDVADRQADEAAASAQLAATLGLSPQQPLRATDVLYPLPPPPHVSGTHPELVLAHRQQRAAELRAKRERAAIRPEPDVNVELEDHPTPEQPFGIRGGLAIDVPLFSQNSGAVDAQVAQAEQAREHEKALALQLDARRRSAEAHWQAAKSRAEFAVAHDVPASTRVRDLAQTAYELGRIPFTSLLQAEADVNRAKAEAVDATAAAWDARTELAAAEGAQP